MHITLAINTIKFLLCTLILILIAPIEVQGQWVFSKRLTVNQGEYIHAIKGSNDGGLYMLYSQNNIHGLCKTDSTGNMLWSKLLNSTATKLEIAPDGSVFTSSGTILSKFTAAGVPVWGVTLSVNVTDFDIASDGEIFCAGGNKVFKLNASGAVVWGKMLPDINHSTDIAASDGGGAYVTGNGQTAPFEYHWGTLIKVSDLGAVQWCRRAQGSWMSFEKVVETPDQEVSVAATDPGTLTSTNVFRFNSAGTPLWNSIMGPFRDDDVIQDMTATGNNGVAIAGISSDGPMFFHRDAFVYWVTSTGSGHAIFGNMEYGLLGNPTPMATCITTTSDSMLAYAYGEDNGATVISRKAWYGKLAAVGSTCKPRTNGIYPWNAVTNSYGTSSSAFTVTSTASTATATAASLPIDALCIHCIKPASAAFSTNITGLSVSTVNNSLNTFTYSWDFGDGNTSTASSPIHSYTQAGTYTICLTATGPCGTDSSCTTIAVSAPAIISGMILHPNQLSAIPSTSIALSGPTNNAMVTGTNGQFSFTVNSGGNYTLTPSKGNDSLTNNGISTLDLLLMQRHILQQDTLDSPYKIIAADVNNSQTITTLDILLTRMVVLQTSPSFPGGLLWYMVDADHIFPNPLSPWPYPSTRNYPAASSATNQDFYGIKMGDVNWSWNPAIAKAEPVGELFIGAGDFSVRQGDEITIPIMAEQFEAIAGFQFALKWDPAVLALVDVDDAGHKASFGKSRTPEGIIMVSWNDESGKAKDFEQESTLLTLTFKVIGEANSVSKLELENSILPAEAYDDALNTLRIVSRSTEIAVMDDAGQAEGLLEMAQFYPNPFSAAARLRFKMAESGPVSILITDEKGKEIMSLEQSCVRGINDLEWDGRMRDGMPLATGVYFLRLQSRDACFVMRIVRI